MPHFSSSEFVKRQIGCILSMCRNWCEGKVMFRNDSNRSNVGFPSTTRTLSAAAIAVVLCAQVSLCRTEGNIGLTEHHCSSPAACRMLIGSAASGKHACASAPVDFNRAAATHHLAAPRIAAPVPANVFQLHSRPAATKVIYLDFDGQVTKNTPWNQSAATITTTAYDVDSNPSSFSSTRRGYSPGGSVGSTAPWCRLPGAARRTPT